MLPAICGAANDEPVENAHELGPNVYTSESRKADSTPSTKVDCTPSPIVEKSTQNPRVDHVAGVRSALSAATDTTPGQAAGKYGVPSHPLPAAATMTTSVRRACSNAWMMSTAAVIATGGALSAVDPPRDK